MSGLPVARSPASPGTTPPEPGAARALGPPSTLEAEQRAVAEQRAAEQRAAVQRAAVQGLEAGPDPLPAARDGAPRWAPATMAPSGPAAPPSKNQAPHSADATDDELGIGVSGPAEQLPVRFEGPFKALKDELLRAFEREYLSRLLIRSRGNVSRAAREAGLDRKHLYSLLHKYGLLQPGG